MRTYQFIQSVFLALSVFLLTSLITLNAEPAQRVIIHFNESLSVSQTNDVHEYLISLKPGAYTLAEHSSDVRWVTVLTNKLDEAELNSFMTQLLNNKLIKHVEIDRILNTQSVISNTQ